MAVATSLVALGLATGGTGASADPTGLSISMTGAPNPVTAGFDVSFLSTVNNSGESAAVTVKNQLPTNGTFVAAFPSQGTCDSAPIAGLLECDLGVLDGEATATVNVVVQAPRVVGVDGDLMTNKGSVWFTGGSPADTTFAKVTVIRPSTTLTTGYIPPTGGSIGTPPVGRTTPQGSTLKITAGDPGVVSIQIPDPNALPCPEGISCYGDPIGITGLARSPSNPITLIFVFKNIPVDEPLGGIFMLRKNVQVPLCNRRTPGAANPDPCQKLITRNSRTGAVSIYLLSSDELNDPPYRGGG